MCSTRQLHILILHISGCYYIKDLGTKCFCCGCNFEYGKKVFDDKIKYLETGQSFWDGGGIYNQRAYKSQFIARRIIEISPYSSE